MAKGKLRDRLRKARDRVLGRQETPVVTPPLPASTSEPQVMSPTAPRHPPVIQLGSTQPVYYYPPAHLQDNLPQPGPHAAPFDIPVPLPSGLAHPPAAGPQAPSRAALKPKFQATTTPPATPAQTAPSSSSAATPRTRSPLTPFASPPSPSTSRTPNKLNKTPTPQAGNRSIGARSQPPSPSPSPTPSSLFSRVRGHGRGQDNNHSNIPKISYPMTQFPTPSTTPSPFQGTGASPNHPFPSSSSSAAPPFK